jgi:hypothetical protein
VPTPGSSLTERGLGKGGKVGYFHKSGVSCLAAVWTHETHRASGLEFSSNIKIFASDN